jgi:hypothetical protein
MKPIHHELQVVANNLRACCIARGYRRDQRGKVVKFTTKHPVNKDHVQRVDRHRRLPPVSLPSRPNNGGPHAGEPE